MRIFLVLLIIIGFNAQATETITIRSDEMEKDPSEWVLVEDDCENPEIKCNQIYVKKGEVENYKNQKIVKKGMQSSRNIS